jgi:hypothetical protein
MRRHNLNATDAAILSMLLEHQPLLQLGGDRCAVIAADHRLLRAAAAEGIVTFDPESASLADVPPFLASI